jgi:hypothetical protein
VPTWSTTGAVDEKRFHRALHAAISELGPNIEPREFDRAMRTSLEKSGNAQGAKGAHRDEEIERYVRKASAIVSYIADASHL